MEINGRLLNFDRILCNDHVISKDCIINIPEKVPLVFNFDFKCLDHIIGIADVHRDETGLNMHATINDDIQKSQIDLCNGLGGYYNKIKYHEEDGVRHIDSCNLVCCSIVLAPVDKECTFTIKEDTQ